MYSNSADIYPAWTFWGLFLRPEQCCLSPNCRLCSVFHLNHIILWPDLSSLPLFFLFLFSPFIFPPVQINSRPSPRPAGGSTRQCGPCKGHHLQHPQGGVSGVHLVVGAYTSFLSLWLLFPFLSWSLLPSVHPCFRPSVPQKPRK